MSEVKAGTWVKALQPGWVDNSKFVKAGDKFQLSEDTPFSDKWMEVTDAPVTVKKSKEMLQAEEVKQNLDVMTFEEQDAARRGKFTIPSVARSEEGEQAHKKNKRDSAKAAAKAKIDPAKAQPVVIVSPEQVEAAKK